MNNTWTKRQDFGFKVGQKVWSNRFGWGTITERRTDNPTYIHYCSDNGNTLWFLIDGRWSENDLYPSLFHIEQTFDYSRPKWQPKPGELCWVWNCGEQAPCIRNFVKVIGGRNHFKSVNGGAITIHWVHCAPFNGGQLPDEFKHLEGGSK